MNKETALARVIVEHAEYEVCSPIDRNDFDEIVRPRVARPKHGLGRYTGHEYQLPFHGCIHATVEHLVKANVQEKVDLFFDEQGEVGKWARDMYDVLKATPSALTNKIRPYLGVCVPHDDKKVVALQAADLFASRIRTWREGELITDPVLAILTQVPCKIKRWPKDLIKEYITKIYPEEEVA